MKNILLKVKGYITVTCIVSSSFVGTYKGNAQTSKYNTKEELFKNAILDCIYQHLRQGGQSSPQVKLLDYKMKYLGEKQGLIKVKRINRNGKYYTYVTDKRSGKIITYQKWKVERKLNKFV